MIRHGRHVPSQCPKQKHFPPVLVAIFIFSGVNFLCLYSFPPEILKMTTNTGEKCFCLGHWLGTWRPWRIMTTAPYAFLNEVAPICSLYSLVELCTVQYVWAIAEQPVQRFYWPEKAINWRHATCVEAQTAKVPTWVALLYYFVYYTFVLHNCMIRKWRFLYVFY